MVRTSEEWDALVDAHRRCGTELWSVDAAEVVALLDRVVDRNRDDTRFTAELLRVRDCGDMDVVRHVLTVIGTMLIEKARAEGEHTATAT
jgi:hypothetical protein